MKTDKNTSEVEESIEQIHRELNSHEELLIELDQKIEKQIDREIKVHEKMINDQDQKIENLTDIIDRHTKMFNSLNLFNGE